MIIPATIDNELTIFVQQSIVLFFYCSFWNWCRNHIPIHTTIYSIVLKNWMEFNCSPALYVRAYLHLKLTINVAWPRVAWHRTLFETQSHCDMYLHVKHLWNVRFMIWFPFKSMNGVREWVCVTYCLMSSVISFNGYLLLNVILCHIDSNGSYYYCKLINFT